MHPVLRDILRLDRLKRAEADVQCHKSPIDSALAKPPENPRREMETGCRRGHGPGLASIDSLVALAVVERRTHGLCSPPLYVLRQRNLAVTLQDHERIARLARLCQPVTLVRLLHQ